MQTKVIDIKLVGEIFRENNSRNILGKLRRDVGSQLIFYLIRCVEPEKSLNTNEGIMNNNPPFDTALLLDSVEQFFKCAFEGQDFLNVGTLGDEG